MNEINLFSLLTRLFDLLRQEDVVISIRKAHADELAALLTALEEKIDYRPIQKPVMKH